MLGPQQNLRVGATQKGQIFQRTFQGILRVCRKCLVEFWLLLNPPFKCFDLIKCKNLSEKVFLISGDCQKPFLGLGVQDAELLKKETTCVIHAAANVKFDQTLKEASHNVRATRDVLELAKQMPNLKVSSKTLQLFMKYYFKVFVHVSTAFSNCVHSHIEERFYTPPMKSETFLGLVDDLDDNTLQAITPKSVIEIQTVTLFSIPTF
jgi:fatty acyl-CoA reductase